MFATDSNGSRNWDGKRVGTRIAEIAPMLRAAHMRLIVALVNNHRAVPGEAPEQHRLDGQLHAAAAAVLYRPPGAARTYQFVRDLISTVQAHRRTGRRSTPGSSATSCTRRASPTR